MGVITHKGMKGRNVSGGMFMVVMRKFCSREIGNPVVLAYRSIGTEELFQTLVNTFGLAIRLRMISGGHGLGDTEGMTEGAREGGSELGPTIRNEFRRKAKVFPDVVSIQVGRSFSGDIRMTWGKDGHLSNIMIHENGNGIEPLGWGESDDKVHRSGREWGGILRRDDRD